MTDFSVNLADFGGSSAASDNASALRGALSALAAEGGGTLAIEAGTFNLASESLGDGIDIPGNVRIRGSGAETTRLVVTGTAEAPVFRALDVSDVWIEDMALEGNSCATGDNAPALHCVLTSGACADMRNLGMRRMVLENFRSEFWVLVENLGAKNASGNGGTYRICDLEFSSIRVIGHPGNSQDPARSASHAHALGIRGLSGQVVGVIIQDVEADCRHIKGAVSLFHKVVGIILENVVVRDAGMAGATDDGGGNAIEIHDPHYELKDVTIMHPRLTDPRSCGIYVGGASDVTVFDPVITGQSDAAADALPKAAIVGNGTYRLHILEGSLSGNWRDVSIVAPGTGDGNMGHVIDGLETDGAAISILLARSPDMAVTRNVQIVNCAIRAAPSGKGLAVVNDHSHRIDDVIVGSSTLEGLYGADFHHDAGSGASGYLVHDSRFHGSGVACRFREQGGSIKIQDCDFFSGKDGICLQAYRCTNVAITDVRAFDATAGYAYDFRSTAGTLQGAQAINCGNVTLGGLETGTWSDPGRSGRFVQSLPMAEAGPSPSGYVRAGWPGLSPSPLHESGVLTGGLTP